MMRCIAGLGMTLLLAGCVSVHIDGSSLDSLSEQFNQALTQEISKLNHPVVIHNIIQVKESKTQVRNVEYVVFELYDDQHNVYRMQGLAQDFPTHKREKLHQLKGATLRGVIQIDNQPNHFSFRVLENPVYR